MYSMVLMAALTTGTDMPDFGRRGGGCCGCYGGYGWGGCYGGCYGGWGGCYGGCYGGWGGCYGGCYGWGGWGGGWGGYASWGGYGGWGYAAAPVISGYAAPVMIANATYTSPDITRSMYYNPLTTPNDRATIIVHLPAKARLIVDGKPTTSTSDTRRFVSPPLEAGQNYHYVFKAEMDRDGEKVTTTQRVDVRPGKREEVYLKFPDLHQRIEREPAPEATPERKGVPARKEGASNRKEGVLN